MAKVAIGAGALSLLAYAAGLVYANGHFPAAGIAAAQKETVVYFVLATLAAGLFHVVACVAAHRNPPRLFWVVLIGAAVRLIVVFGAPAPILEGDPQRLRFDARMVNHGVHPFEFAPADLLEGGEADLQLTAIGAERLLLSRAAMSAGEAPHAEQLVRPDLRTDAMPLTLWIGALADRFKPNSTRGFAFAILCADVLACLFLVLALRAMRLPMSWVLVYAWSPVLLKELYVTLAVDAYLLPAIAALVWCIASGRRLFAAVPTALAASVRLPFLLLVPILSRRFGVLGVILMAALFSVPFLPFHQNDVPLERYVEGQVHVWRHYEYNSVLENPLRKSLQYLPGRAENSLQIAGVSMIEPGEKFNVLLAKVIAGVAFLGLVLFLCIRMRPLLDIGGAETQAALNDLFVFLVGFLVISPILHPAHALWLLPLLAVRAYGVAWLAVPVIASLSYLTHLRGPMAADLPFFQDRISFRVFGYLIFGLLVLVDIFWGHRWFREPPKIVDTNTVHEELLEFEEEIEEEPTLVF